MITRTALHDGCVLLLVFLAQSACAPAAVGTWSATVVSTETAGAPPEALEDSYDVEAVVSTSFLEPSGSCAVSATIGGLGALEVGGGAGCEGEGFNALFTSTEPLDLELPDEATVRIEGTTGKMTMEIEGIEAAWTRKYSGDAVHEP